MKNDSIQCDKLLIQNSEESKAETKAVSRDSEFNIFLEQIEKEIDIQIKGLNDLKNKVVGFRKQFNGGQNIPVQQPVVEGNANKIPIPEDNNLMAQLMALNRNNKNSKAPEETTKPAKGDESEKFLEMLKNETTETQAQQKANDKGNINISLGEIEKQIAMLKSLSVKSP
jgi:hypothetical protein